MATTQDLMGVGMPPALASYLGYNPTSLTCTGTSAGTAALITSKLVNLTAASSQTGAILSSGLSNGSRSYVACTSSTSAVLYPPTGATINGASSLTLAQNKTAEVIRFSTTVFFSILTA